MFVTLISLLLLAGFTDFLMASQPRPQRSATTEVAVALSPGQGGWGGGDEQIVVTHHGGEPVYTDRTTVRLLVGSTSTTYAGAALDGGFSDGKLTIGETWTLTLALAPSTTVILQIVDAAQGHGVIATSTLRTGNEDCSADATAPSAVAWTQSIADVTTLSTGDLDVSVTIMDDCAGVDELNPPRLSYRLDDGTGPAYTDTGPMTQLSATTWRGTVPEPADGWAAHEAEDLDYYLDPLQDVNGNAGVTAVRTDTIQLATVPATITYVTDHIVYSGTLTNFANAQDGSDVGQEATLQEASASGGPTTTEAHATAHTSSGATTPSAATGSPDDSHAVIDLHGEWVAVEGFSTFTGAITKVEFAFEGHRTGTIAGTPDELDLTYEVNSVAGSTSYTTTVDALSDGTDGAPVFVDITADRAWTWTDVAATRIKAAYDKKLGQDTLSIRVDALWLRVSYDSSGYNLSARMNVSDLPTGSHELQMRYRVQDDTFEVDLWNFTTGAWDARGATLVATTQTDWSVHVWTSQVAAGEVRVRLHDTGNGGTTQAHLYLDHMRVRSQ